MSLPADPPRYGTWKGIIAPIRKGETGWRVWALQKAIQATAPGITCDGVFGRQTHRLLTAYQTAAGLTGDGIAGPATQTKMLADAEKDVNPDFPALPLGVIRGFAVYEGGGVLAATNWYTPPGQPAGVDLGPVQWRFLLPIAQDDMKRAFNARESFRWACTRLQDAIRTLEQAQPGLSDADVLRVSVLAHNAPFLYDQVRRNGRLSTPDAAAGWTVNPSTGGPYTHAEWAVEYPARILTYVK